MLFDISDLAPEGSWLDETVDLGSIPWEGGERVECGLVHLSGQVRPTNRGAELRARVEARLKLRCVRCLTEIERPLESAFQLFVVRVPDDEGPERDGEDGAVDPEEIDVFPISGDQVDLGDVMREQIDLALPARVLCDEACRGLCAGCGADLNREACRCEPADDDDPGTGLRGLRRILQDRGSKDPSRRM